MLFDKVIAFDNFQQKIILIVNMELTDLEENYNKAVLELEHLKELIRTGVPCKDQPGHLSGEITPLFDKERYCAMVERAKYHIREGDIFQIVLSNRLEAPFTGSLLNAYRVLRTLNPSPYMFYFSSSDMEVAGASPETLVKLENGVLHTFPLAGTRPRGRSDAEDRALEAELLADPKELAEHNMLVDLGRNDIGKISRFGTVEVEQYHCIERFSHVMHIGSTVRGEIRSDCDALDAVDAILPAGTLSAHPRFGPASLSMIWRTISGEFTAAPSAISTLPATWIPASPSALPTRKTERCLSAAEPELWLIPCQRRNIRSVSTRRRPWSTP